MFSFMKKQFICYLILECLYLKNLEIQVIGKLLLLFLSDDVGIHPKKVLAL